MDAISWMFWVYELPPIVFSKVDARMCHLDIHLLFFDDFLPLLKLSNCVCLCLVELLFPHDHLTI